MTFPDSHDAMILELLVCTTEFLDSVSSTLGLVVILLNQNLSVKAAYWQGC
jgi:hypothetical protein